MRNKQKKIKKNFYKKDKLTKELPIIQLLDQKSKQKIEQLV